VSQSFGKYQLVKKLAAGGMGEVFLTRSTAAGGFEKLLVLKRILPHLSDNKEFLDLFLDEARIAARLNHTNIVQIFELGDVNGAWYLLMEYVAGKDLRQAMDSLKHRHRLFPLGLACRIIADAAAGLDYAHRARDPQGRPMKIVHRDVSPHNVLLSFDGSVKLIDFGVAKAAGRLQSTEAGMLRGKYPYMSPEQVTSGELDGRSDQFSLGVVLWELLTGQRLFKADSDPVTLQRVAQCDVKPPSRKGEALPPALVAVSMRMLEKDPSRRYADLAAVRDALEEISIDQQWPANSTGLAAFLGELYPMGAATAFDVETDADVTRSSRPRAKAAKGSKSASKSKPSSPRPPDATISESAVKLLRELAELPPSGERIAAPLTSFVGRAAELGTLRALLAKGEVLLTLLGPGGAGKTRLATQLALEAPAASLADLTEATDLDGLCAAVARALQVTLPHGKTADDAVAQLGRAMANRGKMLLVLDNFEQLTAFAPDTIGKWRERAVQASFIVTTREVLKLPGETVWEVPPLAEGVQLFLERASAARPGWKPSEGDLKAVEELVRQLDGMPLAIELAAARMAVLSAEQLVQRLPRRFELLAGARADVSARQATLRGAIDWSWELLQGHEQLALAQLSVFRGGFTIEAAEAVIDLSSFPSAPWALDVVQALRDKSLVRTWEAAKLPGELRFGFFESIREYATERLGNLGPDTGRLARDRHAKWYLAQGAQWLEKLETREANPTLDWLQVERENFFTVFQHAPKTPAGARQALEAVLAVDPLLALRGPFIAHLPMLDAALARAREANVEPGLLARGLLARGLARQARSRFQESIEDFEAALQLGPDSKLSGRLHNYVGSSLRQTGKMEEAKVRYEQALERVRAAKDRWFEGRVLGQLGGLSQEMGAVEAALKLYERALVLHREVGDRRFEGIVLGNLGSYYQGTQQLEQARTHFEEALQIHREVGNRRSEGIVLSNLASLVRAEGSLPSARSLLARALVVHREVGNARFEGIVLNNFGTLELEEKSWFVAEKTLTMALTVFQEVGDRRYQGISLSALGGALAAQGRLPEAEKAFAEADALLQQVIDAHAHAVVAVFRGYLDIAKGDPAGAEARLQSVTQDVGESEQVRTAVRALRAALGADRSP
jgi:serine/threonine protein kinase/predicted ATPase/Tfp pilus assembly protein PilF